MCGIIGMIDVAPVAESLLAALRRLEYRGYDSAGMATLHDGFIKRRRSEGKIAKLEKILVEKPLLGKIGIGHTRWATHGAPVEKNAHPHSNERIAIVHNGIIENFASLKCELKEEGYLFASETDSEVILHLLTRALDLHLGDIPRACAEALSQLKGMFALVALFSNQKNLLFGARRGSPLVLGFNANGGAYFGSDALSLGGLAERIAYLQDGEWALLASREEQTQLFTRDNKIQSLQTHALKISSEVFGKGNHKHFMEKEIFEQPSVWGDVLAVRLDPATRRPRLPALPFVFTDIKILHITACGTAYYAALVAKYWLEALAGISVEVDFASELRYRSPVLCHKNSAAICISQSGETMDSLEALRIYKRAGLPTIAVVNVEYSSIARECDAVIATHAGIEIGVASTKAFTTQLLTLACFTITAAFDRDRMSGLVAEEAVTALSYLPGLASQCLTRLSGSSEQFNKATQILAHARDALYLGRGVSYPIALEGALKIKEISYIHAEGYAAGEMKHGPIALVDDTVPIIALAPYDRWFTKTLSNLHEVSSRGGGVILFSSEQGITIAKESGLKLRAAITLPSCVSILGDNLPSYADLGVDTALGILDILHPILYSLPVQVLAHDVAILKGTDVDQPRNLAKSVTVE